MTAQSNGHGDKTAQGPPPCRIAVIGSGLAGLTAAYLLARNEKTEVHLYERESTIGMDHHSLDVDVAGETRRVDVPMRAFAAGYYRTLIRLYTHLGIVFRRQAFDFSFSQGRAPFKPYVVFAGRGGLSGFRSSFSTWFDVQIAWGYLYFSLIALLCDWLGIRPAMPFGLFCRTLWIPSLFSSHLLFPMFCSLATCSRDSLEDYPTAEILEYKARSTFKPHYVVANGVQEVVQRLVHPIHKVFLGQDVELRDDTMVITSSGKIRYDFVVDARPPTNQTPTVKTSVVTHTDSTFYLPKQPTAINIWHDGQYTVATHVIAPGLYQTTVDTSFLDAEAAVPPSGVLSRADFQRARHTIISKDTINQYISTAGICGPAQNVRGLYHVGSWCSHGIPLLEGCVWSAACVADDLQRAAGISATAFKHGLLD